MSDDRKTRITFASARARQLLADFLRAQRWFGGKAQSISAVEVLDCVPVSTTPASAYFLLVRVHYKDAPDETYSVPLIQTSDAASVPAASDGRAAAHFDLGGEAGAILYDATASAAFLGALLSAIRESRAFRGEHGELRMEHSSVLEKLVPAGAAPLSPRLMRAEQSNTSAVYGDRLVLKIFRRVEQGTNPDLEIGWFLTERTAYRHAPPVAGCLEYRREGGTRMSLGILQSFVPNQGDAWKLALAEVVRFFERVPAGSAPPSLPAVSLLALAGRETDDEEARRWVGDYLHSAELLGRRTAELHLALSTITGDQAFDPEPYSPQDQDRFCSAALEMLDRNLRLLRQQQPALPSGVREQAERVLKRRPELEQRFRRFSDRPLSAQRTRIHGDYHLGQVLVSDGDFFIIDFEGEPARPMAERRRKRSPFQDVAGMLRSFHYAAYAPLLGAASGPEGWPLQGFAPWAYLWQHWVSGAFLRSYLLTAGSAAFVSRDPQELATMLEAHLLDKAVYELGYELNNRPSWVRIPLSGVEQLTAT